MNMLRVIVIVVVGAACGNNAAAQCYAPRAVYGKRVRAVRPYVAPVHAYNAYAPVVLRQVYPNYAYSVGAAIQEQALEQRVAAGIRAELSQEIRALRLTIQQMAVQQQQFQQQQYGAQQGYGQDQGEQLAAAGLQILQANCFSCHKQGSKPVTEEGAPVLFDVAGLLTASAKLRAKIGTSIKFGAMPPPPRKPLDEQSAGLIEQYLDYLDTAQPTLAEPPLSAEEQAEQSVVHPSVQPPLRPQQEQVPIPGPE